MRNTAALVPLVLLTACRAQPRPDPAAPVAAAASQGGAGTCADPAEAQDASGRKRGAVPRATTPPAVDGAADQVWSRAPRYRLAAVSPEQTAPDPQDFSVVFQPLWDRERLYLLVDITDDLKKPFDRSRAPHNFDQCEVYVWAGQGHEGTPKWQYGGPGQFAYEAFRDPAELKPTWKPKQTDHAYAAAETTRGWTAELSLPFAYWGFTPAPGATLGFELHCNDGDAAVDRDHHLAWSDDRNEAWRNPSVIGKFQLCE